MALNDSCTVSNALGTYHGGNVMVKHPISLCTINYSKHSQDINPMCTRLCRSVTSDQDELFYSISVKIANVRHHSNVLLVRFLS